MEGEGGEMGGRGNEEERWREKGSDSKKDNSFTSSICPILLSFHS